MPEFSFAQHKGALIAGGLAAAGIGAYFILHKKKTAVTPQTGTGNYGYGSASPYGYGNYGYGTNNGYYGYGLGSGYGYGSGGGGAIGGGGYGGTSNPYGPYGPYGYGTYGYGSTAGVPVSTAPTTNAQWLTEAVSALSSAGVNVTTASAALGLYLAGANLSANQAQIVSEAQGLIGNPPTSGPNGYPPALHQSQGGGAGQGGSSGGTTTTQVAVPNLKGQTAGNAHNALVAAGLHPLADPGQHATDIVTGTNPGAGKMVNTGSTVVISATPAKKK